MRADYTRVSPEQRDALIQALRVHQFKTIKQAARHLGIKYPRATAIYREYCQGLTSTEFDELQRDQVERLKFPKMRNPELLSSSHREEVSRRLDDFLPVVNNQMCSKFITRMRDLAAQR